MNPTKQLFRLTIAFGACALLAPVITVADDTLQKGFSGSQSVGNSLGQLRREPSQQTKPDQ
jgi:hypothetical protein